MSEAIVDAIKNTLIPELDSISKVIIGINSVVDEFTTHAQQHPDTKTFYELCALASEELGESSINALDELSKQLISEVNEAHIENAAIAMGLSAKTLLSKYPTRLSILVGSFHSQFYEPLVTIAGIEHDDDDMQALYQLADAIIEKFTNHINIGLKNVASLMTLLASDPGVTNGESINDRHPNYAKWCNFGETVIGAVYSPIIKYYSSLTQFADKQRYLRDKGFSASEFNLKLAEEEVKFETEAQRELALDEFGLVATPNQSLIDSESRIASDSGLPSDVVIGDNFGG